MFDADILERTRQIFTGEYVPADNSGYIAAMLVALTMAEDEDAGK